MKFNYVNYSGLSAVGWFAAALMFVALATGYAYYIQDISYGIYTTFCLALPCLIVGCCYMCKMCKDGEVLLSGTDRTATVTEVKTRNTHTSRCAEIFYEITFEFSNTSKTITVDDTPNVKTGDKFNIRYTDSKHIVIAGDYINGKFDKLL